MQTSLRQPGVTEAYRQAGILGEGAYLILSVRSFGGVLKLTLFPPGRVRNTHNRT